MDVSARRAQLLELIVASTSEVSARTLSELIYGSASHTVAVRAEISRLRRLLGDLSVAAPYRLAPGVVGQVQISRG